MGWGDLEFVAHKGNFSGQQTDSLAIGQATCLALWMLSIDDTTVENPNEL